MHPRAVELIDLLQLQAHPEGGYYRRLYESSECLPSGRLLASAIVFLLPAGQVLRRNLRLPAAAADRLRAVVGYEIDRQTPFEASQVSYDIRELGSAGEGLLQVELVAWPLRQLDGWRAQIGAWADVLAGVDAIDALQKSYSDGLPDLGYLILMDKIYLVVYALIVLTLIRAIFAYKATTDADANVVKQVYATDKKLLVADPGF